MIYPLAGRLRRGGREGLTRHVVECLLTLWPRTTACKSVHQVLPRWGWLLQAATRNTSAERQGQLSLHRNQGYSPPSSLSWSPPRAHRAGCWVLGAGCRSAARSSGQQGALAGRLPEHLLQREARGITLAHAGWSVSRHSQAISVSCSGSFLVSRCWR